MQGYSPVAVAVGELRLLGDVTLVPPEDPGALLLEVLDDRLDRRNARADQAGELHRRIGRRPEVDAIVERRRLVDQREVAIGELGPLRPEVDEVVLDSVAVAVEEREDWTDICLAVELTRRK